MVNEVVNNDLQQALQDPLAVVDFSATWCQPCRMLAPVLEELSEELDGQAEFYSVDVDENPALAAEYGVSSIPCVVILKQGQTVGQSIGFQPKAALQELLKAYL